MNKERCSECQRVFGQIRKDHPEWPLEDRFKCAVETLRNVRPEMNCAGKVCLPLDQAVRVLSGLQKKHTEIPIPQEPEPEYLRQARDVVELYVLDQVKGHPDKFTAFSAAKGCGCNSCVIEYNRWVDFYAQDNPELLKLKKPLKGQKHIDWNDNSYTGV